MILMTLKEWLATLATLPMINDHKLHIDGTVTDD